jgi:branched-chain amino acid transport system substrate-binding protein
MRRTAVAAIALLVGLACGTSQGGSGSQNVPGVTDTEILIGTTQPLSGQASAYASISKGSKAYFSYLNSRGGVNGRKINYRVYDDGYDPARAVPLVHQLVTQDQVFAVFNELGTPVNIATRPYLNEQRVPDLFIATGASQWGLQHQQYPWTIGYQPDYISEAKIYGREILKSYPAARIGVLYQNDDSGKDYTSGLRQGLGERASMVVDQESYEANTAEVTSQVAALKSSGANVFFLNATPKFASQAISQAAKLGWKVPIYLSNVSAQVTTIRSAITASTPDAAEGIISSVYLKDPSDRNRWSGDAGMKLYMSVMAKYCAGCDPDDLNYIYGMSVSWTFQRVLQRVGRGGVTRDNVMTVVRNLNFTDSPFLLPGITIQTGGSSQFPITQEALERWQNGGWVVQNQVLSGR